MLLRALLLLLLLTAPPSTALQRLGEEWSFTVTGSAAAGLKDGQGTAAGFSSPVDVAFMPNGKALVADWGAFSVRTVDLDTRTVTTTFTSSIVPIGGPRAIAVHPSGEYAVMSTSGNLIVKLPLAPRSPENVSVIAGRGGQGLRDGSTNESQFNVPSGVAFVPGADAVLVCDTQNHAIRLVTVQGQVTTVAGAGLPSLHDGVGPLAGLNMPSMLAVSSWPSRSGREATPFAVFTEVGSNSVRYLDLNTQTVTTLAGGGGSGARDGFGTTALFRSPTGVALIESTAGGTSGQGVFYAIVADTGNGYVRMVTIQYPGGAASRVMTLGLSDRQSYPEGPRGIALRLPDSLVFTDTRGNRIRYGTVSCSDGSYRYGYTCQPCTVMSENCPVGMQPVACTDSTDTYCGPCSGSIPSGAAFYNGTGACSWRCTGSLMIASQGDVECTPDWLTAGVILGGSCAFGIACIGAVFAVERSSIKAKMRRMEEMLAREAAEGGQGGHRPSVQISVAGSFKQKQTPAQRRRSSLLPPPSFEPGSAPTATEFTMAGGVGGGVWDGGMAFAPTKRGRRTSAPAVLDNIDEKSQMKLVDFSPEASATALAPIRDLTEGEGGLVEQNVKYSMVYDSFKDQQVADYALKDYARYFLAGSRCQNIPGWLDALSLPAVSPGRLQDTCIFTVQGLPLNIWHVLWPGLGIAPHLHLTSRLHHFGTAMPFLIPISLHPPSSAGSESLQPLKHPRLLNPAARASCPRHRQATGPHSQPGQPHLLSSARPPPFPPPPPPSRPWSHLGLGHGIRFFFLPASMGGARRGAARRDRGCV